MRIAIVGAGLAGSTIAHKLAIAGHAVEVFEARGHIAGNAYTERDPITGVMVHKYGPHIFHTDNENVWKFMGQFCELVPYIQRTKAVREGTIWSLPINLHTINQFYRTQWSPAEAREVIADRAAASGIVGEPRNFEEQVLSTLGRDLYEAFFYEYTLKQWGRLPTALPAEIAKRIPLRFDYSDNAFNHPHQGIPRAGYTSAVFNMLDHSFITTRLGEKLRRDAAASFDHVFYSGPLDEWFDYKFGRLSYRTLDFDHQIIEGGQGCSVINNCDAYPRWTRSTEHKHFTPWESHDSSIVSREYSREAEEGDEPFYPIRLHDEMAMLSRYAELAEGEKRTTFIGRLGTYQYLDMDKVIANSLRDAGEFLRAIA